MSVPPHQSVSPAKTVFRLVDFGRLRWWFMGVAVVTCAVLYGGTRSYPLVFDDLLYLKDNPLVGDWRSFLYPTEFNEFAVRSLRLGFPGDLSVNFILRPFCYLTFQLNHVLDGFNPRGFRLANIVIHCANAVLVFQLLVTLLRNYAKRGPLASSSVAFIAAGSALLFLAHPLQTESVTYVVQRFTSLGTTFYLLALVAHFQAAAAGPRDAIVWRVVSVGSLVFGMFTKEILFTAPLMLVLLDWLGMGTPWKTALRRAIPALVCLPIIPVMLYLTSVAQHPGSGAFDALHVANSGLISSQLQYEYALTQPGVVVSYVRLLLFPSGLNVDPDFPIVKSMGDPRFFVPVMLLGGIIFFAWHCYRRHRDDLRVSMIFCSVLWFFLTLSIDSSVVPLPDVMAEHRTYLPSIGFLTALVCCVDLIRSRLGNRTELAQATVIAVALWVITLGAATWFRNQVWRSEVALWADTAAKSPRKARVVHNLGDAYLKQNQPDLAVAQYRKAIEIDPRHFPAYNNLATVLFRAGKYQEALETAQRGLAAGSSIYNHLFHYSIGLSYRALGDYVKSFEEFQHALRLAPRHRLSHLEIGVLYCNTGQYELALQYLRTAAELEPPDERLTNLMNELEKAIRERQAKR